MPKTPQAPACQAADACPHPAGPRSIRAHLGRQITHNHQSFWTSWESGVLSDFNEPRGAHRRLLEENWGGREGDGGKEEAKRGGLGARRTPLPWAAEPVPLALSSARAGSTSMGSTYPSPSPQRAAVARRLLLIVDRGGPGGATPTDARTNRGKPRRAAAAAGSVPRAAVRRRNDDDQAAHSTFSKGKGQGGVVGDAEEELGGPSCAAPSNGRLSEPLLCPLREVGETRGGPSAGAPPQQQPQLLRALSPD